MRVPAASSHSPFSAFKPLLCVGLFLHACLPSPLKAAEKTLAANVHAELRQIFEQNNKAVVRVYAKDHLGTRVGSGFFVDPFGTIYTHAGIVLESDEVNVKFNGQNLPAKVVTADPYSGIALLKVNTQTPFITLGDSEKATIATPVIAIGFPEEYDVCPSIGMIAGRDRHHLGQYFSTSHIRANMAVQRGEGGAPVLNLNGEVIGILVSRIGEGTSCHILPIRAAEKIRQDVARFGEARPGWVGVSVEDAKSPLSGSTAQIQSLNPQTPAAQSGLKSGDIILSIGGTMVTTSEDVIDAAYFLTAGDLTEVKILRGNDKFSITVKPVAHPSKADNGLRAEALTSPVRIGN